MTSSAEYQSNRRLSRKNFSLSYLGGKCVRCGSTNRLEFDHIEPSTKSRTINHSYSLSMKSLIEELDKCQILCKPCHVIKSLEEKGYRTIAEHGTIAMYNNQRCRCRLCVKANTYHQREYRLILREERKLSWA